VPFWKKYTQSQDTHKKKVFRDCEKWCVEIFISVCRGGNFAGNFVCAFSKGHFVAKEANNKSIV
jgi:hypothetical protein